MKDEKYVFISDVKDKKTTARSARNMRTHCGKGGRVRFPSDNLSKKELMKMNGECKAYRLNDPMTWVEFKSMPDDLKITYIKLLKKKFNVPFIHIGKMLGVCQRTISCEVVRLGLSEGKAAKGRSKKWDKEGFYAWWHGVDMVPANVIEEAPFEEPATEEAVITQEERNQIFFGGAENLPEEKIHWVEDDLPVEEPDHVALCAEIDALKIRIDELLKSNEELMAVHEKDKAENEWLRNECESQHMNVRILEAQMDVVRMIFGSRNSG